MRPVVLAAGAFAGSPLSHGGVDCDDIQVDIGSVRAANAYFDTMDNVLWD